MTHNKTTDQDYSVLAERDWRIQYGDGLQMSTFLCCTIWFFYTVSVLGRYGMDAYFGPAFP